MQKVDLLEGSIVRSLTSLALPIMATSLIQMAYNMTDMIWIGRVSANAVAAVGAAGMYLWLANGLAMIPRLGGQVKVAHELGAQNIERAASYGQAAFHLGALLVVLFTTLCITLNGPLIAFFRLNTPSVIADARTYLVIVAAGFFFSFFNQIFTGMFTAMGGSVVVLRSTAIGLVGSILASLLAREDLGDSVKYIQVTNTDQNGKSRKPVIEINQAKIDEDLKYAGYNLLVTSELDMEPLQVYHTYHNLWKIEESFRITKSYLDARPVYVQKKETIYGHFLICYLSLFLLRILEIKCFKNEINSYDLVNFMRDFRVVAKGDGTYINISRNQSVNEKIKKLIGLTNLDALYLTEKESDNIFEFTMLIDR